MDDPKTADAASRSGGVRTLSFDDYFVDPDTGAYEYDAESEPVYLASFEVRRIRIRIGIGRKEGIGNGGRGGEGTEGKEEGTLTGTERNGKGTRTMRRGGSRRCSWRAAR